MMIRIMFTIFLVCALTLSAGFVMASNSEMDQAQEFDQTQVEAFGSQLMTQQERMEYRAKLRAAHSSAERDKIRKEHHEQMKERAKLRGVTLPDEPPARGSGMGSRGLD